MLSRGPVRRALLRALFLQSVPEGRDGASQQPGAAPALAKYAEGMAEPVLCCGPVLRPHGARGEGQDRVFVQLRGLPQCRVVPVVPTQLIQYRGPLELVLPLRR